MCGGWHVVLCGPGTCGVFRWDSYVDAHLSPRARTVLNVKKVLAYPVTGFTHVRFLFVPDGATQGTSCRRAVLNGSEGHPCALIPARNSEGLGPLASIVRCPPITQQRRPLIPYVHASTERY